MAVDTKIHVQSKFVTVSPFEIPALWFKFLTENGKHFNGKNIKGDLINTRHIDAHIDETRIGFYSDLYGEKFGKNRRQIHIYFDNTERTRTKFGTPYFTDFTFSLGAIHGGTAFMKDLFDFLVKQGELNGCTLTYIPEDTTNEHNIVVSK